jgi:hypothetical protein
MPFVECICNYCWLKNTLVTVLLLGSVFTIFFTGIVFFKLFGKYLVDHKGEYIPDDISF